MSIIKKWNVLQNKLKSKHEKYNRKNYEKKQIKKRYANKKRIILTIKQKVENPNIIAKERYNKSKRVNHINYIAKKKTQRGSFNHSRCWR